MKESKREKVFGHKEDNTYRKAFEKFKLYGFLSFTAEDHVALGDTPENKLLENPGKALYEILTETEIQESLDKILKLILDPDTPFHIKIDQKDVFLRSIFLLKKVGKLPKKYKDYNLDALSALK